MKHIGELQYHVIPDTWIPTVETAMADVCRMHLHKILPNTLFLGQMLSVNPVAFVVGLSVAAYTDPVLQPIVASRKAVGQCVC